MRVESENNRNIYTRKEKENLQYNHIPFYFIRKKKTEINFSPGIKYCQRNK